LTNPAILNTVKGLISQKYEQEEKKRIQDALLKLSKQVDNFNRRGQEIMNSHSFPVSPEKEKGLAAKIQAQILRTKEESSGKKIIKQPQVPKVL
jgi:hypothetical protein